MKRVCTLLLIAALVLLTWAAFTSYNSAYLVAVCCACVAVGIAAAQTRKQT